MPVRSDDGADRSGEAVEVRPLRPEEMSAAVDVIARGMRDNPLHVAAYGLDPQRRRSCHAGLITALFGVSAALDLLCATRRGELVAVVASAPPGRCRPTMRQRLRLLPCIARLGPATSVRVHSWTSEWMRRDLAEPHVHLGPVAVDAALQGQGLGSLVMRAHCRRLDARSQVGYLETDKEDNVTFYRRFGYEVVGEASVIGVPNWFMRRPSR